ncbi:hypothetical protein [Parasitella parasitica]|uniref:Zn(2)-C6 fungal-type domain-containing protein n=1 Tax=Parasitella parasitica TaxID=35722 RepID=A0A0B7N865_9FUNG|nr:hypothetical protein [Parasitella parasitica]
MNTFQQQQITSPHSSSHLLKTNLSTLATPLKRTRAKRSCDFCRKRKSRCDADASTPCSNCKAWGYTCEFQTVRKKRGPPSVYVDNLERKCKKMESLLSALTKCSIKVLEQNDFQYAGLTQPSSPPNPSESSSEDEEEDSEHDFDPLHEATKDYDSLKYTGQSSAGLKLFNNDIFKSQTAIPWPGRENIVLKLMAQDELMIVRTEKSSTTGKSDMLFDVGLSMRAPLFDKQKTSTTLLKNSKKPARHHLDKMVGMYFSHIHLILPIVNKTKFLEQYHNSSSAGPPSILMQAVLALTFRFAGQQMPDLVKDANEFADMYFRKVMKRLRDSVRSRLCHVQAALLMALYLDMDDGDVESAQWCTVGNAIRMAQDLGLHRSCAKWNLPRSEIETRHRVFYACYVMDRWLSARAGKPLTILDRDFDADMPSPYEITDESTDSASMGAPIYRSFIAMIKLSEILGRVLKALYAPNAKIANTNAGLDDPTILAVFERRLLNWKNSLEEPLDGVYLSKLDKENLQIYYYVVVLLLHRPFNQLSTEKYPSLKSIVAASEKACTNAANQLSDIVNQRQYQTSDPAYYYVLCAPSCYVYALFQSSLVYLSNALRTRNANHIQEFHQSINLIKMNQEIGPAPRAVEILDMLASINGLYIDSSTSSSSDDANKSMSMSADSSIFTTTATTSTSNSAISTPSVYSNSAYLSHPANELPQSHYVQHRLMNTSIIGGITPDIQLDIGLSIAPSCSGHGHLQQKHEQEQHSLKQQQVQYVQQQYPVYAQEAPTLTHHRSSSLDRLSSSSHYSHTRSISHDYHISHSTRNTPMTPVSTSLAANVNSMLSHCYASPNGNSTNDNNNNDNMNSMVNTYRPLPQAPQAYTAAYDPNMNISNSTLPPSSLNWSDWDVYLGNQNPNSAGPQQSNPSTSSPSQHIQYS